MKKELIFPINVTYPMDCSLNPNTGELVLEFYPYVMGEPENPHKFRLVFEPKATLEMMKNIAVIQENYAELIEDKAKQDSFQ
ncbi:hypothetical protein [Avibacterium sp. 21-599]|uniref:hypothetical protein n=1 Tax=Avibacterium sp. 21-599 TaxID=2911528 RepID=UPI002245D3B4|nr:hypothetical protein [Avibacterium sp. 21-599]MCW9717374.1 hypothetical protein [Avibacterium sp. 21-599]